MKALRSVLTAAAAVAVLAGGLAAGAPVQAKEYLLTGAKPNKLFLIDPAERKVVKETTIPGPGVAPWMVLPTGDGKIAYVLTDHNEAIVGVEIDSGKEVFRTDLKVPGMKNKIMPAVELSPDGKEIYAVIAPTKVMPGEYQVQDTKIVVFNTADGVAAKPVREFAAPRRLVLMMFAPDGQTLYALGWDMYAINPKTGEFKTIKGLTNYDRPNATPADILSVWQQFEQAATYSTPYFTMLTDKDPADPTAYKTGMLTVDLASGSVEMDDFEDTAAVIFSTVVNPVNKKEAFGVYTQLSKIDMDKDTLVKRVELPHTYYTINISGDGKEVYVGGTMCDIGVYATADLAKVGSIELPGCPDMGVSSVRMIKR